MASSDSAWALYTHSQKSHLTLQVDFHASKLVNNADEVDRIESFLFTARRYA